MTWRPATILAVLLCSVGVWAGALPSTPLGGLVVENFRVAPEKFPPPNELQNKYLLEGAKAQPLEAGRFLLINARLRTFRRTGEVEMDMATPRCVYDATNRAINSAEALSVKTADGRFSISGVGFHWGQTNSTLVISNSVHTRVAAELLQGDANRANPRSNQAGPLEVTADHFFYSAAAGLGEYTGNVVATSTNIQMEAGILKLEIPGMAVVQQVSAAAPVAARVGAGETPARLQLRRLEAFRDVRLRYGEIHARGEQATYQADSGLAELRGNPIWRAGERFGRADVIRIDREKRLFHSEGNASLSLPVRSSNFPGFEQFTASQPIPSASAATNRLLEISAERYVLSTNSAQFWRKVKAQDSGDADDSTVLTCGELNLEFIGTNELTSLLAQGDVVLAKGQRQFTAQRLDYDAPSGLARFNNMPSWQDGARRGAGRVILVYTGEQEMEVRGDATLQFPAGQLAPSWAKARTNRTELDPLDMGIITCRNYRFSPAMALFEGGVKLEHPRTGWTCERMTIHIDPVSNTVQKVIADGGVRFEFTDDRGQRVHGAGDQAVYSRKAAATSTNGIVELTGNPATLKSASGVEARHRVLLLDVEHGKIIVPPGDYHIAVPTNALGTNFLRRAAGSLKR